MNEFRDGKMVLAARCRGCEAVSAVTVQVGMQPGSRQGGPLDLSTVHWPKVCDKCGEAQVWPLGPGDMDKPSVAFEAGIAMQAAEAE